MAPETLRGRQSGRPADVWAFGVTMWEIYHGVRAADFIGNVPDTAAAVSSRLAFNPPCPEPAYEQLCRACLAIDPEARPTFQQALEVLLSSAFDQMERITQVVGASPTAVPDVPHQQQQQQVMPSSPFMVTSPVSRSSGAELGVTGLPSVARFSADAQKRLLSWCSGAAASTTGGVQ